MTKKCIMAESLLVDYLDGVLSDRERAEFEQHLSQCKTCRAKIDKQKQWLDLAAQSSIADDPERQAEASTLIALKKRIMADIEQETQKADRTQQRKIWHRPSFWWQTAGLAAALLVLVLAMPTLLNVWQNTGTSREATDFGQLAATSAAATEANSKTAGSEEKRLDEMSDGWDVFKGSLADLDSMVCFFAASDCQAPADSQATEPAVNVTQETNAESQEMTAANFFLSSNRSLNSEGQALLDILNKADLLRVIVNPAQSESIVILAAFNAKQVDFYAEELKTNLQTCQNPIEIEIIRGVELTLKLENLEPGLYDRVFAEAPGAEFSWILILIGV